MIIQPSKRQNKRFMVSFNNGTITHFGQKGSKTFIDHGDEVKRKHYIARHATEDWSNPYTPATLSRYLTWGSSKSLDENHQAFMKRFGIS